MRRCEDCGRVLRASGACPSCDDYAPAVAMAGRRPPGRDQVIQVFDRIAAEQALVALATHEAEVSL